MPHDDPRLYVRLAAALRAPIEAGELAPGGRLPPVADLIAAGHGQSTVRAALALLVDQGWAVAVPGRGHFVAAVIPPPPGGPLAARVEALEAWRDGHEAGHG